VSVGRIVRHPACRDPDEPDLKPWPIGWRVLFLLLVSIGLWAMIFGAIGWFHGWWLQAMQVPPLS
jgi:hypothetical protein